MTERGSLLRVHFQPRLNTRLSLKQRLDCRVAALLAKTLEVYLGA